VSLELRDIHSLTDHEGGDRLTGHGVRDADDSRLPYSRMSDEGRLDLDRGEAVPRDIDHVVDPTERGIARIGRSGGGVQPGDVTGLLVDGDHQVRPLGQQRVRQGAHLRVVADVPPEQADRAQ
jgi:hypothetical protein